MKGTIRLLYRKIINANARQQWEKYVLNDSYAEFLLQVQAYNQEKKYSSFSELAVQVPNAEKLHFLVSASVVGYLRQLNGKMPDIVNRMGRPFLPFKGFRFEIIDSDTRDRSKHQVAINFMSEPLVWHDTIGDQLLVSAGDEKEGEEEVLTDMFSLQPQLSIYSFIKAG